MKKIHSSDLIKEVQPSYKRICNIKREEIEYNARIRLLGNQIHQLELERSRYVAKRHDLLEVQLPKAITPYSQIWTLNFVTKMRSYLPRELRDMVYGYLVEEDYDFISPFSLIGLSERKECPGRPCLCLAHIKIPHALNSAFVGNEVAQEVVEALYKEYSKDLFVVHRVESIKNALLADHFHIGLYPKDVAREFTIYWKLSRSVHEFDDKEGVRSRRPAKEDFNPLLEIRNKSGFQLRIVMSQRHIKLDSLERSLAIISPICKQLIEEGTKLKLEYLYDRPDTLRFPLNDALHQSPETWKKKLVMSLDENENISRPYKDYESRFGHLVEETSSEDSDQYLDIEGPYDYDGYPGYLDDDDDDEFDFYEMGLYDI